MEWHSLVEENLGLAFSIARKFKPKNWSELDDYKQQAVVGLVSAAKTFIPGKGKFSSYAGRCIYNSLARYVDKNRKFLQQHRRLNESDY